ncbi:MAG: flagellar hook-basal body complex protein [Vampirovibrio sp.]|nr:flagellar hook-basal body complex protein [Vampirovibrio sp.]
MSQGLFAAVSGVRANQTRLNVISNNVANVNTVGFKSSSVNFATVFAQTITGGTRSNGNLGGTNPRQIGNGVLVAEIPADFSQGGTQFTGRGTDLLINGEGFFAVERVDQNLGSVNASFFLSRAGNFSLDSLGNMVTVSGNRVRGTSQLSGSVPATITTVQIPQEMVIVKDTNAAGTIVQTHLAGIGEATANITAARNAGATGQNIATVQLVNFSIGSDGSITGTYSNGDRISVRTDPNTVSTTDPTQARREIVHLPSEGGTYGADNDNDAAPSTASDDGIVTQIGIGLAGVDGGSLGTANGPFSDMDGRQLQLQTATVTNPQGLLYDGNNNFLISANSGNTFFGVPGNESRGSLQAGALESSNVDIAAEFTNLVITQRGLEAASRVITAHSQVMQTIIQAV